MSEICTECGEIPRGPVCSKGRNAGFPHRAVSSGWRGTAAGSGRPTSPASQRSKSPPSPSRYNIPSYVKHPPSGSGTAVPFNSNGEDSRGSRRSRSSKSGRSRSGRSHSRRRRRRSSSPGASHSHSSGADGRRRRRSSASRTRRRSQSPPSPSYSKSPARSPRAVAGGMKYPAPDPLAPLHGGSHRSALGMSQPSVVAPTPLPIVMPNSSSGGGGGVPGGHHTVAETENPLPMPPPPRIWPGATVERNPAYWDASEVDGGAGSRGTVTDVGERWVRVRWPGGMEASHRWGEEGAFDVSIVSGHAGPALGSTSPTMQQAHSSHSFVPPMHGDSFGSGPISAPPVQRESVGKRQVVSGHIPPNATPASAVRLVGAGGGGVSSAGLPESEKAFCRVKVEGMRHLHRLHYKLHMASPFSQMLVEIFSQLTELAPPEWHLFWEAPDGVRVPLHRDDTPSKIGMQAGLQNVHQMLLSQRDDGWVTPRQKRVPDMEPLHPIGHQHLHQQQAQATQQAPQWSPRRDMQGEGDPLRYDTPPRLFPGNRVVPDQQLVPHQTPRGGGGGGLPDPFPPQGFGGTAASPVYPPTAPPAGLPLARGGGGGGGGTAADAREKVAQEERIVLLETENKILRDRLAFSSSIPAAAAALPLPLTLAAQGFSRRTADEAVQTQSVRSESPPLESSEPRAPHSSPNYPLPPPPQQQQQQQQGGERVWSSRASPRAPYRESGVSRHSGHLGGSVGGVYPYAGAGGGGGGGGGGDGKDLSPLREGPSRGSPYPAVVHSDPEQECRAAYLRLKEVYRCYTSFRPGDAVSEADRMIGFVQISGVAAQNGIPDASITRTLTGLLGTSLQKPPLSFEEFTESMHLVGTLIYPREEAPLNSLLPSFV